MGRYHSGEVLAADDTLRGVYRASVELARPHFGASLLRKPPVAEPLPMNPGGSTDPIHRREHHK